MMLKQLDDYDWQKAFEYAGHEEGIKWRDGSPKLSGALPGKEYDLSGFTRQDVIGILGLSVGKRDEDSWMVAGHLKDGRWFFLDAFCDYTGWD